MTREQQREAKRKAKATMVVTDGYFLESAARCRSMSLIELWHAHHWKQFGTPISYYDRWSMRQYLRRRASWY